MHVSIVGGGPAGLYLAILLRRRGLADAVTIHERNSRAASIGFGIVFSGRTLDSLREADAESYEAIRAHSATWEDVIVGYRGQRILVGGNDFAAVARMDFLRALQDRCESLGVDLRYDDEVNEVDGLLDADLVVGADGVGSLVRSRFEASFEPLIDERNNPYIWLGTPQVFEGLAMLFRTTPAGTFIAHAYEYGAEGSTFVVECSLDTWRRSGLERLPEDAGLAYLEGVFRDDLAGQPLLAKGYRWIRFVMLRCNHWSHDNVVLLGDALHTAHFSIGSGTKLAVEDAIALADALEAEGGVTAALAAFESGRRPEVEALQDASYESLRWLETIEHDLGMEPVPFAYRLMTRSGRVDDDSLRRRDPEFAAAVEAWRQRSGS
jgi:anthraniloyl-CoA monooxygenase